MKIPTRLKSRKFWLTLGSNLLAGYLASKGHVEAATIVAGAATGSYNIGRQRKFCMAFLSFFLEARHERPATSVRRF